jgi:hypothetical protein
MKCMLMGRPGVAMVLLKGMTRETRTCKTSHTSWNSGTLGPDIYARAHHQQARKIRKAGTKECRHKEQRD